MAIFKNQIEDLTGAIPVTCDAEQFLKDGIFNIIDIVKKSNPLDLVLYSSSSSFTSNLSVGNTDIISVSRDEKNCRFVEPSMKASVSDSSSLNYATNNDPVYYISNQVLSVKPDGPANADIIGNCVISNWDTSSSSVSNFPEEKYFLF